MLAALPSVSKRTLKAKGIGKGYRFKNLSKDREPVPEPDDLPALLRPVFNNPEPWKGVDQPRVHFSAFRPHLWGVWGEEHQKVE